MAYKNEIQKCVRRKTDADFLSYKISIMRNVVVVEGVRALLLYNEKLIKIRLKNCVACLNGECFCVAECAGSQLTVCGKLLSVEFENK